MNLAMIIIGWGLLFFIGDSRIQECEQFQTTIKIVAWFSELITRAF